jgi:hypothetical protein
MALWYKLLTDETYETMDIIAEFLDIWLQTRKSEDIDPGELAGVIDTVYEFESSSGLWSLIEVRPTEIRDYITVYVDANGKQKKMMAQKDERLMRQYVKLLTKGHEPTPIMIAGAVDDDTKEEGIVLLDGRHRTYAAIANNVAKIKAYIPKEDLPKMEKAVIKAEPNTPKNPIASLPRLS